MKWLVVIATACATCAATAQVDYAATPHALVQRFDANGDGVVQEAEYLAYLGRGFSVRDTDGDGVLRGSELPDGARPVPRRKHEERLRRQFQRQDKNHDGTLSASELMAPPAG